MSTMEKRIFTILVVSIVGVAYKKPFSDGQGINSIRPLDDSVDSMFDRPEWIVINRTGPLKNKWFGRQGSCVRYCVNNSKKNYQTGEPSVENNYINLIWQIDQENFAELAEDRTSSGGNSQSKEFEDSGNLAVDKDQKCHIQLKIDCDKSEISNASIDKRFDLLLEKEEYGYSENNFIVENDTKFLHVKITGGLSWVLLQIPSRTETEDIELSLMRNDKDNSLQFIIKNTPSGAWRLKLRGSSDNETYNLAIFQAPQEFMNSPMNPKQLPDSNDLANSYEKDLSNRGVVIYFEDNETPQSNHAALKILGDSGVQLMNKTNRVVFQDSREELSRVSEDVEENEDLELDELSRAAVFSTRATKLLVVDLAPESSLIAMQNTVHRIDFIVTNNQILDLFHTFNPRSSQFPIVNISPPFRWIRAGETIRVSIYIGVPNVNENEVNLVTLSVQRGKAENVVQKSAYMYVQSSSSAVRDQTKPMIDYSFYDSCTGKLSQDQCAISRWSVRLTVTDTESGLKRVTSQPAGIHPKTDFTAGTKSATDFIYTSTCCYPNVEISAKDTAGNEISLMLDVTAWYNLTAGAITAIVLGSLLVLLIIVIVVFLCIYWARRRKSADLTYSQRYGSRTAPTNRGVERTSF